MNYKVFKRFIDITLSFLGVLILIPLFPVVAMLIKLGSKGPVLYKQKRVGKYGKLFVLYKFRTMIENAEAETGPVLSTENDQRVTPLGKFLRRTYIDELPQAINILKGNMSFIGPRPERPSLSRKFSKEVKYWEKRLVVTPGLTGLAQINGKSSLNPRKKLEYDLHYINNQSLSLDLKIFLKTILMLIKR